MFQYHPYDEANDFNLDKLRQSIIFFVSTGDPNTLGKTKLLKLLYYADFDHYELADESITGSTYRKLPMGPVPKAAFPVLDAMVEDGTISVQDMRTPSFIRKQYTAQAEFDQSLFSGAELQTLRAVADRWKTVRTEDIVAASHHDPPWNAVAMHGEIPYHLVYYRNTYGAMKLGEEEVDEPDEELVEEEYYDRLYAARAHG